MIPKIIHYCWFGNNPKDETTLRYIEGWKRLLPDYQIKEWNDGNLEEISNKYVTEAYQQKKWAFVSDYFRLYALYNDGGIYFDTDVEVKKSFDEFLDLDFFIGSEQYGKRKSLATAVIGAQKRSKIVARLLKEYDGIGFIKPDGTLDQTPNTMRLRAPLKELGFKEFCSNKDPIYLDSKNIIFPVQYFSKDTPQSYAVHHFAASWVDDFKLRTVWHLPLNNSYRLSLYRYKKMREDAVFTYPHGLFTTLFDLDYSKSKRRKLLLCVEKALYYRRNEAFKFDWKIEKYHRKYAESDVKFYTKTAYSAIKALFQCFKCSNNFGIDDRLLHINIKLGGGLGDIIIALNYLQQLLSKFTAPFNVSIIVPETFKESITCLLQGYNFINNIFSYREKPTKYDVDITLVRVPILEFADLQKVKNLAPNLLEWFEKINDFAHTCPEMLNSSTVRDYLLERYSILQKRNRLSQADIGNFVQPITQFKINLLENKTRILQQFKLAEKFITVQRGVGEADKFSQNSTRCWSLENYNQLLMLIKKNYPDYQLVQLGDESCQKLENVDLDLCGKTTFEELLVILDSSAIHIDGECGMVHLRHFMSAKPSVVLFGPTDENFYGYPENINISARPCGAACEWLHTKWREFCLYSGTKALCLQNLNPTNVFAKMKDVLE